MTPVRFEPAAPRSRVKHSTTKPLRSLETYRDKLTWYAWHKSNALNYLHIYTRVSVPVYYFTIVLYRKTEVKPVKAR